MNESGGDVRGEVSPRSASQPRLTAAARVRVYSCNSNFPSVCKDCSDSLARRDEEPRNYTFSWWVNSGRAPELEAPAAHTQRKC